LKHVHWFKKQKWGRYFRQGEASFSNKDRQSVGGPLLRKASGTSLGRKKKKSSKEGRRQNCARRLFIIAGGKPPSASGNSPVKRKRKTSEARSRKRNFLVRKSLQNRFARALFGHRKTKGKILGGGKDMEKTKQSYRKNAGENGQQKLNTEKNIWRNPSERGGVAIE